MGQSDVLDFLAKNKNRWIDVKEVQVALSPRISEGSVCVSIKKLLKGKFIKIQEKKCFDPKAIGRRRFIKRYVKYDC